MKEVESQRLFLVHWDVLRVRVVAFQDILDEHEHCGWGNPLDLTVKATTSSSFEEGDGLRIYIYIVHPLSNTHTDVSFGAATSFGQDFSGNGAASRAICPTMLF